MFFFLTLAQKPLISLQLRSISPKSMTLIKRYRLLLVSIVMSCVACEEQPNADVAGVDLDIEFVRTDSLMLDYSRALVADSTLDYIAAAQQYLGEEMDFFRAYLDVEGQFQGATPSQQDSLMAYQLSRFLGQQAAFDLLDTVRITIPYTQDIKAVILPPLKRFHLAFPEVDLPAFRTHVNGYNPYGDLRSVDQIIPTVNGQYISFGLQFFMGKDFGYYPPNLPAYVRQRFDWSYLETALMSEIADGIIAPLPQGKAPTLLDQMIHVGLKQYFLSEMLPYTADSIRLRYNATQMSWALNFEKRIFNELMQDEKLFKSDFSLQREYLSEKPYTTSLALESAPRLGEFAGWRIVQAYMERHPEVSLADLVKEQDYEKLFREAKYRPR